MAKFRKYKRYIVQFDSDYSTMARTLDPVNGYIEETGWTIEGEIHEDYYEWINEEVEYPQEYWSGK